MSRTAKPQLGIFGLCRNLILIAIFSSLLCGMLAAQVTSGTIYGSIKDPSGALVPKANVVIRSAAIGVERTVTSSDSGAFVVPNIPPGTYAITVSAQGFKKFEKQGVVLSAADRLNAGDFVLQIGGGESAVTVTADSAEMQLQANSGERSDLITDNQIKNLGLNGRNILDMVKVIPGVISSVNGSVSGTGHLDEMNINGTRANQHEFTIDGASNVDTGNNGNTHVTINTDAIAEVKVLTSNYQAEFGKAAGGQIAVTTKGGTSQFHGNARFFHRHEGLNANSFFAKQSDLAIAKYRYNNAGYQIGGPVIIPGTDFNKKKDKLFFFWSQEYYRQLVPSGDVVQIRVPTALERQGDFSQTTDGNGNPLVIYNPLTHTPFAGNKIDRSQLTASQQAVFDQVSKMLSLYSLPNISGNPKYNYATNLSYNNPRREDILRVDYQLNNSNRLYGRWVQNASTTESPMQTWNLNCMGQLQFPGGCTAKQPAWNLSLNLVSTISPTLINEMSFGPSINRSTWDGTSGNMSRGKNGITLPLLYAVTQDTNIPDFSFNGNSNMSYPWSYLGANPWFQANTTINFNDNLTKVLDNHTLKFGVFYQRSRKDQIGWGNSNGQVNIDNCATSADPLNCTNATGNAYASALLGEFRSFNQSSSRPTGYFRYTNLEFYGQDTWRVNSRLTVDYGMRFTWMPPQYDDKNQLALFDPSSYDPAKAGQLGNGMVYASNGYYRGGWKDRGLMAEPRIGFAYSLFSDNKTLLRGGFGIMHDRTQGNLIFNPVFNNPANVVNPTVLNGNLANLPSLLSSSSTSSTLGGIIGADRNGYVPTVYSFSLGVQHELGWGTTIDIAYVGTLSRHLVTARDINAIPYGTTFTRAAQDPSKYPGGVVPAVEPNLPTAYAQAGYNYSGAYAYDTDKLVPYQGYSNIEYYKFDGTSNYNSLQVSLQRRFAKGLTFGAAYTWSKALTTANSDEDWQHPVNTRALDYRTASWDRTHVFVFNYVYDLPSVTKRFNGPKWLGYLTDGYQLSGISTFETGQPIDTGYWAPANLWTGSNMWGKIPPFYISTGGNIDVNQSVGTSKFNPAAFVAPSIGGPYSVARDVLRGGGMQNWDMSLFKNIPLGGNEQRYIQLRLEAFNVFNHTNLKNVNLNWSVDAPTGNTPAKLTINTRPTGQAINKDYGNYFGEYNSQYDGVGGPRVIQLGAKLYF